MCSPATPGSCDGNAFIRNQNHLLPFVRDFYRRHQQFPSTEDALSYLRDNGLFSGDWEDNQLARANRVGQILAFTEQTFDTRFLSNGEPQPLSLNLGQFGWWVRDRFGAGITVEVADLRRFDPITMTAPVSKVDISAKFVETFLIVADACLNQDPLANKAVPTTRIKKLWSMVVNGATWNQRHFQTVRDLLDRMGVVRIFDRHHQPNKAWRWEAGPNFPAASWKEEQKAIKERCKHLGRGGSAGLFADTNVGMQNNLHNTLYQTDVPISGILAQVPPIRPPPGLCPC